MNAWYALTLAVVCPFLTTAALLCAIGWATKTDTEESQ